MEGNLTSPRGWREFVNPAVGPVTRCTDLGCRHASQPLSRVDTPPGAPVPASQFPTVVR